MKQEVRIIGGRFRGKKITFPHVEGLRPTPDRVRETLFNWLMHHTPQARCLDAFAGSGALGLEAYSRGAGIVYFLEAHPTTYQHLQKIIAGFDSSELKVIQTSAHDFFQQTALQFNLIFLDPPFQTDDLMTCLNTLIEKNLLAENGFVYVEYSTTIEPNFEHWDIIKQKRAGQVNYGLLQLKTKKR